MRKLATIREIAEIKPIVGADRIEVAVVDGWECVVLKSENFKAGDKIIYIEIDSIVPKKPEFEFLADRKYRVRTIKLRKQISQGLVLPLSYLPKAVYFPNMDVTNLLGITKYDPELEKEMKLIKEYKTNFVVKYLLRFNIFRKYYNKFTGKNFRRNNFPTWIVKTDEERIQNLPELFKQIKEEETEFVFTEKLDGTSGTFFLKDEKFGVCSRNVYLENKDTSYYWKIAEQLDIKSVLKTIAKENCAKSVVLQGEIIGEGIQGNKYNIKGLDFKAFNLILDGKKIDHFTMELNFLNPLGIQCVPVVENEFKFTGELTEAPLQAKGHSVLNKKQKREGVVVRNYKKQLSFKIINPEFLLEEK